MDTSIIIAIITGVCTLAGTIITVVVGNTKTMHQLETSQAVTNTKIEALTHEVKEHNEFAKRMPVIEEQIKVINHRLTDLEEAKK